MRQAAIDTLNAWLEQTGITCFVEGELFSTALATDNPNLRADVSEVIHDIVCTVVWKYFVVKKFSWVMEPTKIYYTNNF